MKKQPVIAIFDIGKTNKKLVLLDEGYQVVEEIATVLAEATDEDGFPCEDLAALRTWAIGSLRKVLHQDSYDVKAVNFSAYGAAMVLLDESGRILAPMYNYLKPFPDQLCPSFERQAQLTAEIASPILGSLNTGLQLYRLKIEKPAIFSKLRYALHLPQYMSFLLTGKYCSDITSIGCHTALWNFGCNSYHEWAAAEGLLLKLALLVPGDTVFDANFEGHKFSLGIGMHDSSAALVPYLLTFTEPFVLVSTGTWSVSFNPFDPAPLTAEELQNDCLSYMRPDGKPVKAARLNLGYAHDREVESIAAQFNLDPCYFQNIVFDPEPNALTPEAAYHGSMMKFVRQQEHAIRLINKSTPVKRLFVDGGFSKNPVYMNLLAAVFPDKEVFAAIVPQASAIGAALAIHRAWNNKDLSTQLIEVKKYSFHQWS